MRELPLGKRDSHEYVGEKHIQINVTSLVVLLNVSLPANPIQEAIKLQILQFASDFGTLLLT